MTKVPWCKCIRIKLAQVVAASGKPAVLWLFSLNTTGGDLMKDIFSILRNGFVRKDVSEEPLPDDGTKEEKQEEEPECRKTFEHQAFEAMGRIYQNMDQKAKPSDRILVMLQEIMDFYQADWAGIISLDLSVQVWTPYMWISMRTGVMGWTRIQPIEYSESFDRWVACFQEMKELIINDREEIRESEPEEYENYVRLNASAVMAYPFNKKQKGFLLVRNQKQHIDRPELLKQCCPILVAEMNEESIMKQVSELPKPTLFDLDVFPEDSDIPVADVVVGMFGDPCVKTRNGMISLSKNHSPIAWRLFSYLLLNQGKVLSRDSLIEAIGRDAEVSDPARNLRDHIYNFRSLFREISEEEIIENVRGVGYRIGKNISIVRDYEMFDRYLEHAKQATTNFSRMQCLETAVRLYKGKFFAEENDDPHITDAATKYHIRYLTAMEELLRTLFEAGDYDKVQKYAGMALKYESGKMEFYYWLILALKKCNLDQRAMDIDAQAENNLDEEEYHDLCVALKIQIR